MEKAIKNKVAKAVVPAIDVMFQALRFAIHISWFHLLKVLMLSYSFAIYNI